MLKRFALAVLALMTVTALRASPLPSAHLAVILVDFPSSDPPHESTLQFTHDVMDQVDAFYLEQSYGQFTLTSDVFGVYTVPLDVTANRTDIATAAQAAAISAGVDLSVYDSFLYVSPRTTFVAAGYGNQQGVWIAMSFTEVKAPQFDMAAHELGHHLFNLLHANGVICENAVYGEPPCQTQEYGDTLDVMGMGEGHFSPVTKAGLGWLTPTGIQQVQAVTADGDYTILPYASQLGGVKALTLPGGSKKGAFQFYLTYKQPIGYDTAQPWADPVNVFNGALVHRSFGGSQLLSFQPVVPYPGLITQPALIVGQSYCDPNTRTLLTVLAADPTGLMLRVNFKGCH